MSALAYYNEFDPYAAQWLRNLIAAGHLPAGEVDERSIVDVAPADLAGFTQCHFFAGIGGWPIAARLAGWADDRELWTGSAPCQPFSVAGQGKAQADDRHLWPHLARLIRARRPAVFMGEQVAAAVGKNWLDGVFADLEGFGYACGAAVVPACAVDAPHRRDRLWFVAYSDSIGRQVHPDARRCAEGSGAGQVAGPGCAGNGALADADLTGTSAQREQRGRELGGSGSDPGACTRHVAHSNGIGSQSRPDGSSTRHRNPTAASNWAGAGTILGHDGKARRVGTRVRQLVDGIPTGVAGLRTGQDAEEVEMIPLLAHGVPARVGKLRAFGNAIVPAVAAEVIGAFMDCYPERRTA